MKEAGFDMDELEAEGFGDPELDALAKEMGKLILWEVTSIFADN